MLTAEPQWIALYTNPRAEKKVEQNLLREGYEVYLPIIRELHNWSDRKKWVEVPLIKSYIFVKITSAQEIKMRDIQGVSHIVKFKNNVVTVPEREIQMMKDFIAAEIAVQVRTFEQLRPGRAVRIKSGPLSGMLGILVSDCEEGNFAVQITGISMALVTYIQNELLEPLDDSEPDPEPKKKEYNIR